MKTTTRNILLIIGGIIVVTLALRYVILRERFDQAKAGLERIGTWQDDYRKAHPGASDEEVDAAFKASMANIELWQTKYKQDHPNASKAEMDAAFTAMFKK